MEEMNRKSSNDSLEGPYSDGVNELMDRKPSFIIKHGISIVFFLLVLFFLMTNFIPYTDSINVNAILLPNCHEIKCQIHEDGEIVYIFNELEKKVKKNDTLAIIKSFNINNGDNECNAIVSPFNGMAYKAGDLQPRDLIYKGDLLLMVCDSYSPHKNFFAKSFVGQDLIHKIDVGMKMTLNNVSSEIFRVSSISQIPDRNGLYIIYYEYVGGEGNINKNLLQEEKQEAKISTGTVSVYKRFFEGIFNFVNY